MLVKLGEAIEINKIENSDSCIPILNEDILNNFRKLAADLKKIAPKADDFLYFSATIIHAAESVALNDDGTIKLTASGNPVEVGWDTSNGTWKWKTNDPLIKPYKNCFIAGTQILMEDASIKNIEDISIGDIVITHNGEAKKVLNKFITPHNDKIISLYISNNEKIDCTENHPFYIARNETKDSNHNRVLANNKSSFIFVDANNLNKTDVLLQPIINKIIKSDITINKGRILGLYAAEGSLHKDTCVVFSFGTHEKDNLVQECCSLIEQEYPDSHCTINIAPSQPNKCSLSCYNKSLFNDCEKYVGKYSSKKQLSSELVFANNEIKSNFILGWLEGDGHVDKDTGKVTGTTVSKNMANQIRVMLNSLNINNTFYKQNPVSSNTRNIIGKFPVYRIKISYNYAKDLIKNSNKLSFNKDCLDRKPIKFINGFKTCSLLGSDEYHYTGNVYNLEVEDNNTYIANGIIVHNCNGDIFSESELIKAYKKWIGKPLCVDHKSNSVDHIRGFIVDTYYDRNLKRVVALCALDKKNYPDLARKVSTGYSNNVSMGTGVGKAICFDCGRVARTEVEFCEHMKNKTCYGEINIDLNPIELSIVVNGADPKARIKHIIAAANTLNNYVESKEKELSKLAEKRFSVTLCMSDGNQNTQFNLEANDLNILKKDIDSAFEQLQKINESLQDSSKDFQDYGKDTVSNQSTGNVAMDETVIPNTDFGLAPPHVRFASTNVEVDLVSELKTVTTSIETKLSQMKNSLDKLINTSTIIQEENMSGSKEINKQSYFQGAGDENEPSPGQPKYPKDPTNEKLRTDGDKHMDADDMGPVDGMHPGPASVGMSELERKKMLARAESEERAMRRNAIVNLAKQALEQKKNAYYLGGGGVNDPTPGKTKYQIDKLQDDLREDSDKQMVGQKPFPGVGQVNGLHPSPNSVDVSDEKKRKEMLQRASLRARFVKVSNTDGSLNLGKSAWEVFRGDQLLLTASVNDLSNGNVNMFYDSIATKEFGAKLIEKIKVQGADKVRSLIKSAQNPPEAAPVSETPAASVPPNPEVPTAPEMPLENLVKDKGKSGDPKDTSLELAEKVRDLSSDLVEAVRALTGEQVEMGEETETNVESPMGTSASDLGTLNTLRKELNGALIHAMKESIATLNEHDVELNMIVDMYDKGINEANKDFVSSIVEDATNEAKTAVADGFKLMSAFVKYARGTQAIVKRAEIEAELQTLAEGETMSTNNDLQNLINETDDDLADAGEMLADEQDVSEDSELDELLKGLEGGEGGEDVGNREGEESEYNQFDDNSEDSSYEEDDNEVEEGTVTVKTPEQAAEVLKENNLAKVTLASFDTRQGRAAMRAKLAAEALKTSPHLHEAHPKGGFTTDLDVKPSDDLAKVEDLEEQHDAMMDVATAPPKVRKEAEAIHKLVSEGKLDPADLDGLIAEGLDKDAVAYYRKYYGQVDGGSEFASELVKEHVKAELEEELNKYRVKLARAYELTYDMVDRGLCHKDRVAISYQVDEIMKFNDESFESLKRVVAKNNPIFRKESCHMPQVGLIGTGDTTSVEDNNLVAQLSAALSTSSKKMF